jgi:hypothetical protein
MKKIIKECLKCKAAIIKNKGESEWEKASCFIAIDLNNNNYTCGISGIVDLRNVYINSKTQKVICATCDSIIYQESDRNFLK